MQKIRDLRMVAVVLLGVLLFASTFSARAMGVGPRAGSPDSSTTSSFSFSINLNQTVLNVQAGGNVFQNLSLTYQGSSSFPVSLRAIGYPPDVTVGFNPDTCTPTCIITMTVSVTSGGQAGSYQVTIIGNGGGVNQSVAFTLNVGQTSTTTAVPPGFFVSCQPSSVAVGSSTTCTAGVHSSNSTVATGVVSWLGFNPAGLSPAGFSPPQCTLSGGACSVSYTLSSQVAAATSQVKIMASYVGDSHYPKAMAGFTLTVIPSTTTVTTSTFTSGSFTSTFTSTINGTVTSGTVTSGTTTTTSTSGLTLPSLPSLSMSPLVPLAVMVATIVVAAVMAVNWLRAKGTASPAPTPAKEGTQDSRPEESGT